VGFEQATRQAGELGVPIDEELVRLAIHGTLHVLGHDHPEDDERERSSMFVLQERLVRDVLRGEAP
jgi:probable rRNA maturation factor